MDSKYLSEYEERIARTPCDFSRWSGKRGESECLPITPETKVVLEKYGQKSVRYSDGIPDFSPFAESTVKISGMSGDRTSTRTKLVDKNNAFGRAEEYHYRIKEGNYKQADKITAKVWTETKREGRSWSSHDVELYRKQNDLTWHECNDRKTMMLIPTRINSEFTHLGGASEAKTQGNMENLITQAALHQTNNNSRGNAFGRASEKSGGETKIRVVSAEHGRKKGVERKSEELRRSNKI